MAIRVPKVLRDLLDVPPPEPGKALGWGNDGEPTNIDAGGSESVFTAACTADEAVGDLVGLIGADSVRRADPTNRATLPVVGVVVWKVSPVLAVIQTAGRVTGVYSGLVPGQQYVVGAGARPSTLPLVDGDGTQKVFVQKVGVAATADVLSLQISPDFVGVYL